MSDRWYMAQAGEKGGLYDPSRRERRSSHQISSLPPSWTVNPFTLIIVLSSFTFRVLTGFTVLLWPFRIMQNPGTRTSIILFQLYLHFQRTYGQRNWCKLLRRNELQELPYSEYYFFLLKSERVSKHLDEFRLAKITISQHSVLNHTGICMMYGQTGFKHTLVW